MKCSHVNLGGSHMIICGRTRVKACTGCGGRPASKLCDWKLGLTRTCDAALCDTCSYSPAPDKDLCRQHRSAWEKHPANKTRAAEGAHS